jgi:glycogen debranching enzyme
MTAVKETQGVSQVASVEYEAENPSQDRIVIKNGAHFLIMNDQGMMPLSRGVPAPFGLFRDDTRYMSAWQIFINKTHPRMLARDIASGFQAEFVYGNPKVDGIPEQSVLIARSIVIEDRLCEKLVVTNYHSRAVDVEIAMVLDSDFADMFEVRGAKRPARGSLHPVREKVISKNISSDSGAERSSSGGKRSAASGKQLLFSYRGLDGSLMRSVVEFRAGVVLPVIENGVAVFKLSLKPQQEHIIESSVVTVAEMEIDGVAFRNEKSTKRARSFDGTKKRAVEGFDNWRKSGVSVTTGNTAFNDILERAYRDLYILRQPTPKGMCIGAGTPWFAAAFGRDQAVTALQLLHVQPSLAKEVIEVLAAYQGKRYDAYTEERPGKILHELRLGEMARCGEIPFKPYYGTVDATPLWLMLVTRYVAATGDMDLVRKLWSNIQAALDFLDSQVGATGYLTYGGRVGAALSNQGWKDSGDSIMYSDGKLARAPIALCEPQGYLYEAWARLTVIAYDLGEKELAQRLARKAQALRLRFNSDFWMKEHDFVALALDSEGEQCDVVSSNPGHLLSTGILFATKAQLVARKLMSPEMFCGWGIRTLAEGQAAYNPMSYHNGSVWPHDNGMAVEGLCAIGRTKDAHRVLQGLFNAAQHQPDQRLPELFCGFNNAQMQGPIRYPVSCVPQAWAAGTMFQIVMACLGIDLQPDKLRIVEPAVPAWLGTVEVKGLRVGGARVDLRFDTEDGGKTNVFVVRNKNKVSVEIER